MAEASMPMLIINMGGEMVYILEQRLTAQAVATDKAKRVLQDVVRTMFNPKFILELFRSQELYSVEATRQIFDRLAHSSIMRLNDSSMDKLFDLMTMGFKYQMLTCRQPQELLLVTLKHLHEVRAKVSESASVANLVDDVIQKVYDKYLAMNAAEYAALKQDGLQGNDGTIVLSCQKLPTAAEAPGFIRWLDASGRVTSSETFPFPVPTTPSGPFDLESCTLGLNLYAKPSVPAPGAPPPPPPRAPPPPSTTAKRPRVDSTSAAREILSGHGASESTKALNRLADLISAGAAPVEAFKLNLFPDTSMGGGGGRGDDTIVIEAGGKAQANHNRNLVGIMADMRVDGGGGGDEDDLLDLLDRA